MVDPYVPAPAEVADGASVTFDGSEAPAGQAILASAAANFDAQLYYEAFDGTDWQEISLIGTDAGEATFTSDWHSQGNRLLVVEGERRLRIDNVDSVSGRVAVDGDQV